MINIYEKLGITSNVSIAIISIALRLFCGFLRTRLTKLLRLPNVTAYILAGIIIGPFCLNLIPDSFVEGSSFLADIALAFIAFSTGEFFRIDILKKNGLKVIVITVFEALRASILVFLVTFLALHLDLAFSIVLGALAAATAPASTLRTIKQTHAQGDFVETLLQVVALDDVVGLLAYSVAVSIAVASISHTFSFASIRKPIGLNLAALVLGGLFGLLRHLRRPKKRSTDNRLIISIAILFAFCGLCSLFDVSPLLGCRARSTVYINVTKDDKLFKQLNYFTPPILLLFFVRIAGKYSGAYLGCLCVKKKKEVRNYLGLALIPQAGVAIGLAALGARTIGGEEGKALETIILASSVLYELIGPALSKLALYLSHSYGPKSIEAQPQRAASAPVDPALEKQQKEREKIASLIQEIKEIQKELPEHGDYVRSEEEKAFLEASEEVGYSDYFTHRFFK